MKSFKGVEVDQAIVSLLAEGDGLVHKPIAKTTALCLRREDEPPEVRPVGHCLDAVDRNTPFDLMVQREGPKAIPKLIISTEKFR